MVKTRKIISASIQAVGICAVILAMIIGGQVTKQYELAITTELCPEIVNKEEKTKADLSGQKTSSKLVEEGAVLLKNNGVLPLKKAESNKVNVFGWRSIEWAYGSVGNNASGTVAPEDGDASKNVDLLKALTKYGIKYNEQLQNLYKNYYTPLDLAAYPKGNPSTGIENMVRLVEPNINNKTYYTQSILDYAKNYSDTAIVVIGRLSGEDWNAPTNKQIKAGSGSSQDNTKHYLELTTEERELLTYVGANYDKTIVLLNTGNVFELGFLDEIPGIDACMYVGYTGTRGASVIPELLYSVSPSGHLTDTYPYDLFTNPTNIFVEPLTYSDYNRKYLDLIENIYVGYKWYETADSVGYWNSVGGYNKVVQFPFGYGLSYTTFDWEIDSFSIQPGSSFTYEDKLTVNVNVTNKGSVTGKDVVELYMSVPYISGGIEKSSVNLVGFAKTGDIKPGESELISIEVNPYDFASYDCYDKNSNGHTGYELDAGDYVLSLRTDSHTVKNVKYNNASVAGCFTFTLNNTTNIDQDPITGSTVKNLFTGDTSVDIVPIDGKNSTYDPQISWLSRSNFLSLTEIKNKYKARKVGTIAKFDPMSTAQQQSRSNAWDNATIDDFGKPTNTNPTSWGQKNGLTLTQNGVLTELAKKLGENYDDPDWNRLLSQLTQDDIINSMINGYYGTKAVNSIGKPILTDYDGPAQIKGFRSAPRGIGFPNMTLIASTWNSKLMYDFGKTFGDSMVALNVNGVWGWAMDNHRSAFFGRSCESPSEDPFLSGKMIARAVKGLNTRGRYCFLKHFSYYVTGWAFDQDQNAASCVFSTEQALRETTLKAFRFAFVEGEALGCMTSYEGFGAEHSETTIGLLDGVLRREWKFKGAITTDYVPYGATNSTNALQEFIRAGGNLGMNCSISNGTFSNRFQNRLKDVVKEILWTWLHAEYNSRFYAANPDDSDNYSVSTTIAPWVWWKPALTCIFVLISAGLVFWAESLILSFVMPNKKDDNKDKGGKKNE